ncbi:MAG: DUF481 domain-containing protein [Planctomycetota bacterium]|nr:DUF481 domain-containing protein [Planctomycetota bacterium]
MSETSVRELLRAMQPAEPDRFGDGTISDNRAYAAIEWNRDFKELSKWFYFSRAEWELDQLQAWNQRVGAYLGAGYQLVEDEDWHATEHSHP